MSTGDQHASRSRLGATFARLRSEGRTGLVTFVSAGDPTLERSAEVLRALDEAGADVLEVGVPFSDPLADGVEIQRASERALAAGATLPAVLDLIGDVRPHLTAPVVVFTYANPVIRFGPVAFARRAAEVGVDGVLVLDLPIEEAGSVRDTFEEHGLDTIFLLSPTTTQPRIERAAALGRGFLYGISRLGVTGARDQLADSARALAARIRAATTMPLAMGFGLSRPEHIVEVGRWADAAVVGSALVKVIARYGESPDLAARVGEYVRWLKGAEVAPRSSGAPAKGAPTAAGQAGTSRVTPESRMEALRSEIDRLDAELVRLLNLRLRCALVIGALKRELGIAIYQPQREGEVLANVRSLNRGPLDDGAITRLFERIIDEARRIERLGSAEPPVSTPATIEHSQTGQTAADGHEGAPSPSVTPSEDSGHGRGHGRTGD